MMTNQEDQDWVAKEYPYLDDLESFSERVSIMVIDGGLDENEARKLAAEMMSNG